MVNTREVRKKNLYIIYVNTSGSLEVSLDTQTDVLKHIFEHYT